MKKVEDEADEPTVTIEKLVEIVLGEGEPKKKVWVGVFLSDAEQAELLTFLRSNMNVFAWSHKDMPRIACNA